MKKMKNIQIIIRKIGRVRTIFNQVGHSDQTHMRINPAG
jgi:hypothetical protein